MNISSFKDNIVGKLGAGLTGLALCTTGCDSSKQTSSSALVKAPTVSMQESADNAPAPLELTAEDRRNNAEFFSNYGWEDSLPSNENPVRPLPNIIKNKDFSSSMPVLIQGSSSNKDTEI